MRSRSQSNQWQSPIAGTNSGGQSLETALRPSDKPSFLEPELARLAQTGSCYGLKSESLAREGRPC